MFPAWNESSRTEAAGMGANTRFSAATQLTQARHSDPIEILKEKYLGCSRPAPVSAESDAEADLRFEACDLLLGLSQGKSLTEIASQATHPTAFAIAVLVRNLSQRDLLKGSRMDLDELIHEISQQSPGLPSPMTSRFWFLEALRENGLVSPDSFDRRMKPPMSIPSIRDVFSLMEDFTGVSADRMKSADRNREIVDARFKTIFVIRRVCLASLTQIGMNTGGRDHSTILNGLQQAQRRFLTDHGQRITMLRLCNLADEIGTNRHLEFLKNQMGAKN